MISAGQVAALSKTMARTFEQAFPSTVTIAGESVACSSSGFSESQELAEDASGMVPIFLVTLRIRREVLEAAELEANDYGLGATLTHQGRAVTVSELTDRAELEFVVLRCKAPGAS